VTVAPDRERVINETVSQLGRLDILVNNAAYYEGDGTLPEFGEDGRRPIRRDRACLRVSGS